MGADATEFIQESVTASTLVQTPSSMHTDACRSLKGKRVGKRKVNFKNQFMMFERSLRIKRRLSEKPVCIALIERKL